MDLAPPGAVLRRLRRTDPAPRVRHRADGLLLVAGGMPVARAASVFGCARNSLRTGGRRFLTEGRDGLVDCRRLGRPPKLDAAARELLATALAGSPLDDASPGGGLDRGGLDRGGLDRGRPDRSARPAGWTVSPATVSRALHTMGYRYRRPRHDRRHRQAAAAVASATHALAELQKKGRLPPPPATASSTWTSATCTPIPTWRRSGSAGASR